LRPREEETKRVVVDTSGLFAGASKLGALLAEGCNLVIIDLIVFEFVKVVDREINLAKQAGKTKRIQTLTRLRDRFPALLHELEVELVSPDFTTQDLKKLYSLISKGKDPADCMIWLKMQNEALSSILTDDTRHWKGIGAHAIGIYDEHFESKVNRTNE
jgi:hypothetical protein